MSETTTTDSPPRADELPVNFRAPRQLVLRFRSRVAGRDERIKDVLARLIQRYLDETDEGA